MPTCYQHPSPLGPLLQARTAIFRNNAITVLLRKLDGPVTNGVQLYTGTNLGNQVFETLLGEADTQKIVGNVCVYCLQRAYTNI